MQTYFPIQGLLIIMVVLLLAGLAVWKWLRPAMKLSLGECVAALDETLTPQSNQRHERFEEARSRLRAQRQTERQQEDQARAWLSEARSQFGAVLEEQRGIMIRTSQAKSWTGRQIQEGLRRLASVHDEAMGEEVECAKRLFGERTTRAVMRQLDIAV